MWASFTEANDSDKRTDTIDTKVKTTFKAMVLAMRQFKNRFFHIPPLAEVDFAAFKISVPDTIHTISGDLNDKANKGFLVYCKIVVHGEKPPASPSELALSIPERQRIFTKAFDFEDSGKTVYFYFRVRIIIMEESWGSGVL